MPNDAGSAPGEFWTLDRPNARRSLAMCAAGALIGLGIAGLGLFTAQGTRTAHVPAEDVALVNQVPILMSDYLLQLRALDDVSLDHATPAQKHKVLEDMIREELFVQRGIELGMQADTVEVRAALVGAVEAQEVSDATMAQPGEQDLRNWYTTHIAQFSTEGVMMVDDHVLPRDATLQVIAQAQAALKAGKATAVPLSGRMAQSEEFYFAARIHLGDRLFAAARGMAPGQVSAPMAMPDGVHLLVMKRNVGAVPLPYDQVRDRVLNSYVDDQAKRLTAASERFLEKRADIQVAKDFQ